MAEHYQFEMNAWRSPMCMACEEMLADALDETLSVADKSWFDRHLSTCAGCSERMAEAQRGAAWLEMLKSPRPEPSANLMDRILAATSEGVPQQLGLLPDVPQPQPARILPFRMPIPSFRAAARGAWMEPRLAMTAAMAFFSVALTLNLSGVKLNELHARDLSPTSLKRTYFQANAGIARYYDNLRVVRVMESRVDDLREATASDRNAEPEQKPAPASPKDDKAAPAAPTDEKPNPGVSRRETPAADPRVLSSSYQLSTPRNTTRTREGGLA